MASQGNHLTLRQACDLFASPALMRACRTKVAPVSPRAGAPMPPSACRSAALSKVMIGRNGPKAPVVCLAANGPRPARATISAAVTGLQRCAAGLWLLRFTGHAALRSPLAPNRRAAPCPRPAAVPRPAMRASRPSPAPKRLRLVSLGHESAGHRPARRRPFAARHGARMAARNAWGVLIVLIGAGPRRAD